MSRILIVDDDPELREVLKSYLEEMSHEVEVASDGAAALEAFRARRFHLVVTDILMPAGNGLELMAVLRDERPEVPVIAVSGGSSAVPPAATLTASRALGAAAVFMKPFKLKDLGDRIGAILSGD